MSLGGTALCADIGGSFITLGRLDGEEVLSRHTAPTPASDFARFADTLGAFADREDPRRILPLGVSLAGVVDPDSGLAACANIPCLNDRPVARELSHALGRPVVIANDADCFSLAEALRGAGQGHAVVFGVILGSGVGGGLVIDGRLVRGRGGITGEWGHAPVFADVPGLAGGLPCFPCGCGQSGCLDTVGGARGLERLHHVLHGEQRNSREILDGWQAGLAPPSRTVHLQIDLVSRLLALVVNTIGPSAVPVGGGLGSSAPLVAALDEAVRRRILRPGTRPLVVPALHHADAALFGAGLLARHDPRT